MEVALNRLIRTLWPIAVVLLIALACALPTESQAPEALRGEWRLSAFGSGTAVGDAEVTATFAEGGVAAGRAACNYYEATYRADTRRLELAVRPDTVTAMACLNDRLMELEREYVAAMADVPRFERQGDRLNLLDETGALVLAFERPRLPMGSRPRGTGRDALRDQDQPDA
jgi:heat shock protein HslJ